MSKWFNHGDVHTRQGLPAENLFRSLAEQNGWTVACATNGQDRTEHWDFGISRDRSYYKVDVKGQKRIARGDTNLSNDLVWVEFKNGAGQPGWLYGKADLIAFEYASHFLICHREGLLDHASLIVDRTRRVTRPGDALCSVYTRRERHDEVSLLPKNVLLRYGIFWDIWFK